MVSGVEDNLEHAYWTRNQTNQSGTNKGYRAYSNEPMSNQPNQEPTNQSVGLQTI